MDKFNLGRFSDPPILILASLAGSPKHGYAIMEDIETFSGVHLGPGHSMELSRVLRLKDSLNHFPPKSGGAPIA
ncbi:hypothetical protein [Dictyobacter kobayashii]|uniref:Uncharacterized protein n=1 Tax=Dictyobacter kobayashii TaxID=2014872 RepID=A0A402AZI4_9CHLR|nr:hypothetical protein [Dictyobacter kobayashii]GCE24477.1 hypothetical protein KDK_82770 [Dictyobacter kobayashii]